MVQTGGATPCGCPVGGARVGHLWMGRHRGPPLPVMVHGKPAGQFPMVAPSAAPA
jgi:hypothetical protein